MSSARENTPPPSALVPLRSTAGQPPVNSPRAISVSRPIRIMVGTSNGGIMFVDISRDAQTTTQSAAQTTTQTTTQTTSQSAAQTTTQTATKNMKPPRVSGTACLFAPCLPMPMAGPSIHPTFSPLFMAPALMSPIPSVHSSVAPLLLHDSAGRVWSVAESFEARPGSPLTALSNPVDGSLSDPMELSLYNPEKPSLSDLSDSDLSERSHSNPTERTQSLDHAMDAATKPYASPLA